VSRAVVTGGAGFVGSHVCDALLEEGWDVVAVDNLLTGRRDNLADALRRPGFELVEQDVSAGLDVAGPVDAVLHLASPASPVDYLDHPLETLAVGSEGTRHALELACRTGARFLLASTSEVYGDPLVHPRVESYRGNVSTTGPRSVYDEAKRFAEAIAAAYSRTHGVRVGIARIFNTYGPRLRAGDGRVVSNFLVQAMDGAPITVYGDGRQTRSFCYVDDEVRGLLALLRSDHHGPVNIGNPGEFTILELAQAVLEVTGSTSEIEWRPLPEDDPVRRRPDITLARQVLDWEPAIELRDGLARTYDWFRMERGLEH
jgi:nucleoside-diphosphate-sugar epimerase